MSLAVPSNSISTETLQPEVLNDAADVLQVGCVITDENLIVRSWNRWMEAATAKSAADVIGRPLVSIFPAMKGTVAERAFERAVGGESVVFAHSFHEYLLPIPAPPGFHEFSCMQQSARIVPLVTEGQTAGVVALIEDVTERIARERALDDAKQRAEAANKTKSDFLAAMSHELRTPLTAILGYADLMDSEIVGPLNSPQKEQLHRIVTGAWHLINIIEEILTFSRVEAQRFAISLDRVDVALVVRDVQALLENQTVQKGIGFTVSISSEPLYIDTDAMRLKQILLNIVGNAIKFTDKGSVEVRVQEEPEGVAITVSDTGPGIPAHYRDSVFEPFVQVDQSYTRRKGGTGLGLPLSRSLAELMGGKLQLVNTSEPGATFVLRLPRRPVVAEA